MANKALGSAVRNSLYRFSKIIAVIAALALLFGLLQWPEPAHTRDLSASTLLRSAIDAQGGEDALRSIKTIRRHSRGYRNMFEQSERPEGPYIVEFQSTTLELDFGALRSHRKVESDIPPFASFTSETVSDERAVMRIAGARQFAGTSAMFEGARQALLLDPVHLLLTALAADDLRQAPGEMLQSQFHDVVKFDLDGAPVTVFLNRHTHLPTALEYGGALAHADYWRFTGDVPRRTYFSSWMLGDEGIRLPMQVDVERDGRHEATYLVQSIELNAPLPADAFVIPDSIREAFSASGKDSSSSSDANLDLAVINVAPGVDLLQGAWNVALIRQDDGIVILEAPISSDYSEKVIAEANRLYPRLAIKAVVSTSDAWPHIAGLRPYMARSIPIYALDLNRAAIEDLAKMPYRSRPDMLAGRDRSPRLRLVEQETSLGHGKDRMKLLPLRGETTERQLLVYFPDLDLMYASDAFQINRDGVPSNAQAVSEVLDTIQRNDLEPQQYFMMHVPPKAWSDVLTWWEVRSGTFPRPDPESKN